MKDFYKTTGNVFIKLMHLEKAGDFCIGHAHKYGHISCLAHGSVSVNKVEHKAPAFIEVPEGQYHQYVALEDDTVLYCVHDTRGLLPDDLGQEFKG